MGTPPRVPRPRLHLIDGSGYIYRAFHALPGLRTTRGLPTNAVYGFTTMVAKLLREERPRHLAVVLDAPGGTFRDTLYAGYKDNRPPMPDDLRAQLAYIRRVVAALRLPVIEVPGVEADDVLGTLSRQAAARDIETVIVTGDKDMMQLVDERTTLLDTMRDRRTDIAGVRERFGVDPALVPDVLGLMGDPIDNIPGVTGIGEKTASALVRQLGPVEDILARLEAVETCGVRGAKKVRDTLAREAETARLSKTLATIRRDVPLALDLDALEYPGPDVEQMRPLFAELEFLSRLRELVPATDAPVVEQRALANAGEARAAAATLGRDATVSVVLTLDSPRATAARVETIALGAPAGPVSIAPAPDQAML